MKRRLSRRTEQKNIGKVFAVEAKSCGAVNVSILGYITTDKSVQKLNVTLNADGPL